MGVAANTLDDAVPTRRMPRIIPVSKIIIIIAVGWVAVMALFAVVPGIVSPADPLELNPQRVLQEPGETLLGTDQYGRDVAALLVHGAQQSLIIGVSAMLISLVFGGGLGLIGAYIGGKVDLVIGRIIDILMCFPGILLALIIAAALGPSLTNLILAVGIGQAPVFARVMRGQVLSVKSKLFVEAAHAGGLTHLQVISRHVLPNCLAPMVVLSTIEVGTSLVSAAALSFLGAGPSGGVPDWGRLIADGQPYLGSAWWITTFAGIALTLTVISISLIGDWLRDALDTE